MSNRHPAVERIMTSDTKVVLCPYCGDTGLRGRPDFLGDTRPVTMSYCDCPAGQRQAGFLRRHLAKDPGYFR